MFKEKLKKLPIEYIFSTLASIMVIVILFFEYTWANIEPFIKIIVFTFFISTALASLIYLVTNRQKVKRSYMPLLIQLVTFLIFIIVQITNVTVLIDFWVNLSEREEVVEMIQNGKLTINKSDGNAVLLPNKYRHLLKGGGQVFVIDNGSAVCFLTYQGREAIAFYYVKKVKQDSVFYQSEFQTFRKITDNWYWRGWGLQY